MQRPPRFAADFEHALPGCGGGCLSGFALGLHAQLGCERAELESFLGELVGVLELPEAGVVVVGELAGEVVGSALQAGVVVRDVLVGILDALQQAARLG